MKIPSDLNECFKTLDNMNITDLNDWLKNSEDRSMSHFGIGQWIRNNWGLWFVSKEPFWKESLQDYFHNIGIHHPDDMSGIILTSYHRFKNGKDIDLDGQVQHYIDYWDKHNIKPKLKKK